MRHLALYGRGGLLGREDCARYGHEQVRFRTNTEWRFAVHIHGLENSSSNPASVCVRPSRALTPPSRPTSTQASVRRRRGIVPDATRGPTCVQRA